MHANVGCLIPVNSRTQIITKIVQVIIFQPPALFSDACQYWSRQCAEHRYDGGGGKSICQSEKLFVRNIKTNGIIKLLIRTSERSKREIPPPITQRAHLCMRVCARQRERERESLSVSLKV